MKRLVVINGGRGPGTAPPAIDWRLKLRELRAIEATLNTRRAGAAGPRVGFSLWMSLAAGAMAWGVFAILSHAGVSVALWIQLGVLLALMVVSYQLGLRFGTRPWTYTDVLDGQLAFYNPVDLEGYRRLQDQTKEAHSIETIFVQEWLERERHAVALARGLKKPEGFLDKKV